jgi:hypothetical protein
MDRMNSLFVPVVLVLTGCGGGAAPQTAAVSVPPPVQVYSWSEPSTAAAFAGRDGAGALVFHGKAWLLGGWRGGPLYPAPNFTQTGLRGCCTTSEVWNSADGVHWSLVTVAPWGPRHMAGWAVFNDRLWVVGGDDNSGQYDTDVWSSADGVTWDLVTNAVPWAPRVLHYTVAFNGALYVIGGQELPAALWPVPNPYPTQAVYYSDVWESTDGSNWEQIGTLPHALGMICGGAVLNGELWVVGGGTYGDDVQGLQGTAYAEVWSSADGVTWQQHANAPWPARRYHNLAVFNGELFVLAGIDALDVSDKSDVWHSADGDTWSEVTSTPWVARHAASVFVLNGALFLTGGTDNGELQHNDIWSYAP